MRMSDLAGDTRGLALTEFALSLPVLLALALTGVETANYVLAVQRVSQVASVVADTAGRGANAIDDVQVNEIMTGARMIGQSIGLGPNGRIILSDLEQSTSNTQRQWIRWQRCSGAKRVDSSYGTPGAMAGSTMTAMGPAGNQIAAQRNTAVMFVEVMYDYQPIVAGKLIPEGNRTIRSVAAYNVRQRNSYALGSGGLSDSEKALCSVYG